MSFLDNSVVVGLACFVGGSTAGYWLVRWKDRNLRAALALKEESILENARRQAETIAREARVHSNEEALKLREQTELSFNERRTRLTEAEKRLVERESLINRQLENMVQEEKNLREKERTLRKRSDEAEQQRIELHALLEQQRKALEGVARLSEVEAKAQLLKEIETEALQDASLLTRRIMEEAKARAEEKARRIISMAIQRYAGEHTFETTSATLALPDEELKGRIIGREGRNIRAFEAATGVTVLIDDTPNAVVLSGFDPVRREVARESMQRLILDGRIHPTRIEEVVSKVSQEMDETIMRAGEDAVQKTGLPPMQAEVVRMLGRLRFRHSFS
ncbi:MAG TPA: Rnase Y domain-containing protein, partial [Candidatus Saccharimonadales bacterium]|nr:Rnase Y domain-containing protein [Candidatus Saccharimonadales bacterium]